MKHLKSNWMSNLKTQNEALADLILGILIFGILVVFVGLFAAPDKAAFVLGTVLGTAASVIRAVHMAVTLDRQLDTVRRMRELMRHVITAFVISL